MILLGPTNFNQRSQNQVLRKGGGPGANRKPKKRTLKVLEKWPPDVKTGTKSPKRGRPLKRLQEPAQGKEDRGGKDSALKKWLVRERTGPESNNTSLGPWKS